MSSFLSLPALRESMINVFRRFPAACGFAIGLSVALIIMVFTDEHRGVPIYYFTAGFLLSLMLALWNEEYRHTRVFWTVTVAAHVLLLVDAIILWNAVDSYFDTELFIARSAVYVALILGILFLPFYGESSDIKSWNFTRTLLIALVLSFIIGFVMSSGAGILLYGVQSLFGIKIDEEFFEVLLILLYQLLPMLLFLSRIPEGERKHDESILTSRFLTGTVRYLFIPLVACYMLVLYGYLAKIILTWELPNGTISWLVTIMMFGIIIIEFLLYPTMRSDDTKGFERWVVRWMPLLALPLVILMTVGIVRRFDDYGITVNRLYILTLNLWYYVVCIGLFVLQARRIHWIPLSFGALLLLTSAQPMNYCEIVKRHMRQKVENLFAQYQPKSLPMNDEAYDAWLQSLPKDTREQAQSLLYYLKRNYNGQTETWIDETVYINRELFFDPPAEDLIDYKAPNSYIALPQGYSRLKISEHSIYDDLQYSSYDSIFSFTPLGIDDEKLSFDINLNELKRKQQQDIYPIYYEEKTRGKDILLSIDRLYIFHDARTIHYKFYIFYR